VRRAPPRPGRRREIAQDEGVAVADVVDQDADGELYVRLVRAGPRGPLLRLAPASGEPQAGAPGLGDRLLVRLAPGDAGEARLVRRLENSANRTLGVVRKVRGEMRVEPVDRRQRRGFLLHGAPTLDDGDIVLIESSPSRGHGPASSHLIARIGREEDARAASLIAAYAHGLPIGFSTDAVAEAEAAQPPGLGGRTDLRSLPLITIDPADARDHDDAVWAEPHGEGWIVWVAIADVAAFVRPGSALDRDAREKGNSVYFPDRVEPMLPEALSAGLCSLSEGEDRACLAVRMVFGADGKKRSHRFERALMRSAASLTYEQAQAAIDGAPDAATAPLLESVLRPLWAAYGALKQTRDKRGPLAITSVERRVVLDPDGKVAAITPRESLEAHRLIEECMIQANVCAAETLEQRRSPLLYRVHESPSADKLAALKDFLASLDIPWSAGQAATSARFNQLLSQSGPHAEIVNEVVLRTQMQAVYARENLGHFGLNLDRYAHFTSPIRRYADLIVHRSLISALGLGDDGLSGADVARLEDTAERITAAERRGMAAERSAIERYLALFLTDRVGGAFEASITGVTRFGLFVRLRESGAEGLVPIASLGGEYFVHETASHSLVGERSGVRWRLGARLEVRLREASPVTGGLLFEVLSDPEPAAANFRPARRAPSRPNVRPGRRR
jgi:ribonuclease R